MTEETKKSSSWSWRMSDQDLKSQVDNYGKLTVTKSAKGNAFLAGLIVVIISFLVIISGLIEDSSSMFFGLIIYAIFLIFIYRGHKWAIIAFMVMYTLDQGYSLYNGIENGNGSIWPIIWWLVITPYFWKALQVENAREKSGEDITEGTKKMFCKACGTSLEPDSKFCIKCGSKTK